MNAISNMEGQQVFIMVGISKISIIPDFTENGKLASVTGGREWRIKTSLDTQENKHTDTLSSREPLQFGQLMYYHYYH
jgi:hypothetical protein